jgi:integrase/recombinase XerC
LIASPGHQFTFPRLDFVAHKSGHGTMNRTALDMEATAGNPPLAELVDLYLVRCQVEGKSVQTVTAYRYTLGRFLRSLEPDNRHAAAAVGPEQVYRYLGRFTHLTLDSRHRYFREVRCFFNWLVAAGYLAATPFAHLRNVRLPSKIVRPFTPEDVQRLVAACSDDTPAGVRDRAIVLLLDTGLRVSELAQLALDDLDLETMRLRVLHAKGNKQRVAPFADGCRRELLRYLHVRGVGPGPLFCATDGHGSLRRDVPLQPNGVKQLLRRLGKKTGIARVHAHRFRHTFATWAIEQGARELDVQLLLGHASPDMVRRYTSSYNAEQAARRHGAFSPVSRIAVSA